MQLHQSVSDMDLSGGAGGGAEVECKTASSRNFIFTTTLLRILQKLTKKRDSRIAVVMKFKAVVCPSRQTKNLNDECWVL
jgi:hypothetical protein